MQYSQEKLKVLENFILEEFNISLSSKEKEDYLKTEESNIYKEMTGKEHFKKKLVTRLKFILSSHLYENSVINLKKKIKELFSRNDEGAYHELAVYSYFSLIRFSIGKIEIDKKVDSKDSFSNKNTKEVDFDGFINYHCENVYFDVKTLRSSLENRIIEEVKKTEGLENLICYLENDINEVIDFPIKEIIGEAKGLIPFINLNEFYRSKSQIIEGLIYEKKQPIHITTSQSNPYKQSLYFHDIIFKNHSNKILKNAPCIMFYVNSNFHSKITSEFNNHNKIFYYDFARRVFCQYQDHKKPPNLSKEEEIIWLDNCEKSKHVSAIVFIEDKLRYTYSENKPNMHIYAFRNPNAKNKLSNYLWESMLDIAGTGKKAIIEFAHDFYYDNY
ncbi:MAG: hypothetical protein MUE72_13630 [Chitinophagaceae bacterium]|nr:hypothetical protein [Chitinophagaceae bacterium]MCU0394153.1 hypothetical protein [Thermoflexibacter sp.]